MICFVEALVIGCFFQEVFREKNRKTVLTGSILAIVICGGLLAWMYSFKNIKPDHKVCLLYTSRLKKLKEVNKHEIVEGVTEDYMERRVQTLLS